MLKKIKQPKILWISCLLLGMLAVCFPGFGQKGLLDLADFSVFKSGQRVFVKFEVSAGNTCDGIRIWRQSQKEAFNVIYEIPGVCGSDTENRIYVEEDTSPVFNQTIGYRLEFGSIGFSDTISVFLVNTSQIGTLMRKANDGWQFYFENPTAKEITLTLFDLHGKRHLNMKTRAEKMEIPFSLFPTGLVLFKIQSEDESLISSGKLPGF